MLSPSPLSSSVLRISLMSVSSISSLVLISCFSIFLYLLFVCVGCAIVKSDHAPDCGVAQGVVHGVIGHHGKKQEEVEGELGQEVERTGGREHSNTSAHDYDHG